MPVQKVLSQKIKCEGNTGYYLDYDKADGRKRLDFIFIIYNVSESKEHTALECFQNGWWQLRNATGFDTTQFLSNAKKSGYTTPESVFGLIDTLGHPSCVYRDYDSNDALDAYYLCYEYDTVTIIAVVDELTVPDPNDSSKEIKVLGVKETQIYAENYCDAKQDWFMKYMKRL